MNPEWINRRNRLVVIALGLCVGLAFTVGIQARETAGADVLDGKFWKAQSLAEILPWWTRAAVDRDGGGGRTYLDRQWRPGPGSEKFPSMISRNIFGYSVAYLMTGEESYLKIARNTVSFLVEHAWDGEFGGWYDILDRNGNPLERTKDSFVQVYAITGLVMYYIVTGDPDILRYIEQANLILETRTWDGETGGYVKGLERNLEIKVPIKDFASQAAPISGYLLYLYLATGEGRYLEQMERVAGVIRRRMVDPESGWILETFDRQWKYLPSVAADETEINIGHNIETAWIFLRLFLITGKQDYRQTALRLAERLHQYGWDPERGVWYGTIGRKDPRIHSDFTYWWIQAYGNMFQLALYRVTGESRYLDCFRKGANFWNSFFIDKEWGDTYLSVYLDGRLKDGTKANRFKASYHNMEHGLLNYLYLNFWVRQKPVELHFYTGGRPQEMELRPILVEDRDVAVDRVRMNGGIWTETGRGGNTVRLPAGEKVKVTVSLTGGKRKST